MAEDVKLHCSRGEVTARVGDEFGWFGIGEGRWRIEGFTANRIYSPSGFGGAPIVRCRPLGEVPPYWAQYVNDDGTVDWCGDSVGAALMAALSNSTGAPMATDLNEQLAREEKAHAATIGQRDAAEEALSQVFYLITGRSPEWSNVFSFNEAIEEIDATQHLLRQEIASLRQDLAELANAPTPSSPSGEAPASGVRRPSRERGEATRKDAYSEAGAPNTLGDQDWRHVANEWADMATSGLHWLRNIRDGISTVEDALKNMEENLAHCRSLLSETEKG